jgi:DNA-binding transcriptional LysR family regulator
VRAGDLSADPVIVAYPASSIDGRSPSEPPALAEIARRLIVFPRVQGPTLHEAIINLFRRAGLEPTVAQEASRIATILTLVGAGLGSALVPAGVQYHLPMAGVAFSRVPAPARHVPRWPLSIAHMPLTARGVVATLLSAWAKSTR